MNKHYNFSPNDPPIKLAKKLQKKKESDHYQLCLVEGWKCIEEASHLSNPVAMFIQKGKEINTPCSAPIYELDQEVFSSLCSTQSPEGALGIFPKPQASPLFHQPKPGEIHLILYQWRDPNNVGAVIRSARGFGVKHITLWGDGPDFFSPKVIRSSMGSVFHTQLHKVTAETPLPNEGRLLLADAGGTAIQQLDISQNEALHILIGSESHGWPDSLHSMGEVFSLPLENQLESLSAPIAASVSIFAFRHLLQKA